MHWIRQMIGEGANLVGAGDPAEDAEFIRRQNETARRLTNAVSSNSPRRQRILSKTSGHCWYCGLDLANCRWVIEHKNGHHGPHKTPSDDLVPACYPCNNTKRHLSLEDFRAKRGGIVFYGERTQ